MKHSLQAVVLDSGFPLLRLGDRVHGRHPAVLVVDGALAVLGELLARRAFKLTQRAVVGRLADGDCCAALVVLARNK